MSGTDFYRSAIISIHALLAESDTSRLHKILADWDFYPRSPCGERLGIPNQVGTWEVISIHALLAESDAMPDLGKGYIGISIHALLAESDCCNGGDQS